LKKYESDSALFLEGAVFLYALSIRQKPCLRAIKPIDVCPDKKDGEMECRKPIKNHCV
jgi:hypothetical protein